MSYSVFHVLAIYKEFPILIRNISKFCMPMTTMYIGSYFVWSINDGVVKVKL